jgi:hypothetical protein
MFKKEKMLYSGQISKIYFKFGNNIIQLGKGDVTGGGEGFPLREVGEKSISRCSWRKVL